MFVAVFHVGRVAFPVKDRDKIFNRVLMDENEVDMGVAFVHGIALGMDNVGLHVDDSFHKGTGDS